ncbi:uncharacterized protein LOC131658465 [Vicia villosa]|uniref:uncharacterized protein LOC131658465 n=1 Tax=Vicia villosa TaxID=3911 RepID=UPI00273CF48A|nr:uncharacterized protein LOC131658465 [Vicia villosa]
MGWWSENSWHWKLENSRNALNAEAAAEVEELQQILTKVAPKRFVPDGFSWPIGGERVYVVRDYYRKLIMGVDVMEVQVCVKVALKVLWHSWMPSKVKIFGWRLLQDRLATREQLVKRGILENDERCFCVFGCSQEGDIRHLFLDCDVARRVWEKVANWLGLDQGYAGDCCSYLKQMVERMSKLCSVRRAAVIWMCTSWCIWKQRNDVIFENGVRDIDEIFHNVQMYSWWWLNIGNKQKVFCSFYEWRHSPINFM